MFRCVSESERVIHGVEQQDDYRNENRNLQNNSATNRVRQTRNDKAEENESQYHALYHKGDLPGEALSGRQPQATRKQDGVDADQNDGWSGLADWSPEQKGSN